MKENRRVANESWIKAYGNTQLSFFYFRKWLSEGKRGVNDRISWRKQKTFG